MHSSVWAKDIATEQYNLTAAKKQYAEASAEFEAATERVRLQQSQVAREQAALKEELKKQSAAKALMIKAKTKVEQQQKVLDQAWKTGGH